MELLSAAHPAAAHGPHVRQHGCPQSHLSGKRLRPGLCRSLCLSARASLARHPTLGCPGVREHKRRPPSRELCDAEAPRGRPATPSFPEATEPRGRTGSGAPFPASGPLSRPPEAVGSRGACWLAGTTPASVSSVSRPFLNRSLPLPLGTPEAGWALARTHPG